VVFASAVVVSPARADDFDDFEYARQAYEARNWRETIRRFDALVGSEPPRLSDPVYIVESRKYLAAAYVFENQPERAEAQFERLLDQEPNYEIDPNAFSPDVVAIFNRVDRRMTQLREEREARERAEREAAQERERQRLLRENQRLRDLEARAREERVVSERSRVIATVPFGVGQFQNGNVGLGVLFAVSEVLLGGAAIGLFAAWLEVANSLPSVPDPDIIPPEFQDLAVQEQAYRVLNQISFGLWAALTVAGIAEAHLNFVPTQTAIRERELERESGAESEEPPDPPPAPEASLRLSPLGASFRLTF
jgi:hypothetical protein